MRCVVQRISEASVEVEGKIISSIGKGFLVLAGFTHSDTEAEIDWCCRKIAGLRVFEDADEKMNLSLSDINGEVLVVSQFTLYADVKKGNRPSFVDAAKPEIAIQQFDLFCAKLRSTGLKVKTGQFGAYMRVQLLNDGPVTIIIEREHSSGT